VSVRQLSTLPPHKQKAKQPPAVSTTLTKSEDLARYSQQRKTKKASSHSLRWHRLVVAAVVAQDTSLTPKDTTSSGETSRERKRYYYVSSVALTTKLSLHYTSTVPTSTLISSNQTFTSSSNHIDCFSRLLGLLRILFTHIGFRETSWTLRTWSVQLTSSGLP